MIESQMSDGDVDGVSAPCRAREIRHLIRTRVDDDDEQLKWLQHSVQPGFT
jgi:hypothetical protein